MPSRLSILLPSILAGCAIIGGDAHQDRIDALTGGPTPTDLPTPPTDTGDTDDTDPPTLPAESPPVLEALEWRFRFSELDLHRGLQLMVKGSDPDGDLAEVQIQGGDAIAWEHAEPREDGWFLVPIDLDLGPACEPTGSADLNVFLRDFQGNTSQPRQLQISWEGFLHDETSIQSFDECEPCVSGLTNGDVPFVACGYKGSQGYVDYYDAVQYLMSPSNPSLQVTANYASDAANLRLSQTLTGDTEFIQVVNGSNDIGQTFFVDPPATPAGYDFSIDATSEFSSGTWTLFVQRKIPGLIRQ